MWTRIVTIHLPKSTVSQTLFLYVLEPNCVYPFFPSDFKCVSRQLYKYQSNSMLNEGVHMCSWPPWPEHGFCLCCFSWGTNVYFLCNECWRAFFSSSSNVVTELHVLSLKNWNLWLWANKNGWNVWSISQHEIDSAQFLHSAVLWKIHPSMFSKEFLIPSLLNSLRQIFKHCFLKHDSYSGFILVLDTCSGSNQILLCIFLPSFVWY